MNKPIALTDIQPDILYYTDITKDCVVKFNRIKNNTIFFELISKTNGGYLQEPDGTLAFPLNEFVCFYEK
jgi:hypothetical protein